MKKEKKKEKKNAKKGTKILLSIVVIILLGIMINWYQNNTVVVQDYVVKSAKITKEFDQYKILQLTDLHSTNKKIREKTIAIVKEENPDLIVITGDLIDSTIYRDELVDYQSGASTEIPGTNMLTLLSEIKEVAPIYYVYGNHEMMLLDDPDHNSFKVAVEEMGISILNIKEATITKGSSSIQLLGLQDPATLYKNRTYAYYDSTEQRIRGMLDEVTAGSDPSTFTILLSHRPEFFEVYSEYPIDLALTGHAHGGQFRIPFIGGVYAPSQGFFPKYEKGVYQADQFDMIVGVGIGNSRIPVRIFNPPEVVVVTLEHQ